MSRCPDCGAYQDVCARYGCSPPALTLTGEEVRFRDAFYAVLKRDPDTAPGPTAINLELGKTKDGATPLNVLNGRMNALRKRLLVEAGFTQPEKWARWRKA